MTDRTSWTCSRTVPVLLRRDHEGKPDRIAQIHTGAAGAVGEVGARLRGYHEAAAKADRGRARVPHPSRACPQPIKWHSYD